MSDLISRKDLLDAFNERYDTAFVQERTRENKEFWNGLCTGVNWGRNTIAAAPTVDAVVLPCKIGDDVYIIPSKVNFELNVLSGLEKNNRVYHQKVAEIVSTQDCWYARGNADKEYGTGRVLLDIFYKKTWFLTQEEAEAALAKMDGGDEDG